MYELFNQEFITLWEVPVRKNEETSAHTWLII